MAVVFDRQAIATKPVGYWSTWRLAVRVIPPGDTCINSNIKGAWRLTALVPCQGSGSV